MFFHAIPRSMPAIPALMNVPMGQLDAALTGMVGGGSDFAFRRDIITTSGARTLSADTLDVANITFVTVSAQTGTADDCKTLVNPVAGATYILQAAPGHTITIKHGTGNIFLNNVTDEIISGNKQVMLFYSPLGVATDLAIPPAAPPVPPQGTTIITPRTVVGGTVANITLSSIPATASHLLLIAELRQSSTSAGFGTVSIQFNGDTTAANYYSFFVSCVGTGFSVGETLGVFGGMLIDSSAVAGNGSPGNSRLAMWILNYASTTLPKVILTQSFSHFGNASSSLQLVWGGGDWRNVAAAISSIVIAATSGNLVANSAYELYGFN